LQLGEIQIPIEENQHQGIHKDGNVMTKGEVNTTIGVLYDMAVMLAMKGGQKTIWS
jgi:hypothetical protein